MLANTFNSQQWRIQDLQTGAKDEAPIQAGGVWGGVSHCPLGTDLGGTPHIFFDFGSQNGDFRCILGTIFYSSRRRRGVGVGWFFFYFWSWNSELWSIVNHIANISPCNLQYTQSINFNDTRICYQLLKLGFRYSLSSLTKRYPCTYLTR